MAMFHVFVEGPVDTSPGGVKRLAAAIAASYGLPAADLESRLAKGRFRVKANVDEQTAQTYVMSLQGLGARVALEDAAGVAPRTSAPSLPPLTTARPATSSLPPANAARPATSSLPPANAARPATSSLPPATTAAKAPQLQSGLSAAFSLEAPAASLGALENLSLSSLDGQDDAPPAPAASFAPPPGPTAAAPVAKQAPVDLFAPPDAESGEEEVLLAMDEVDARAKGPSIPPITVPVAAPSGPPTSPPLMPSMRRGAPSIQPASQPITTVADSTSPQRVRFAAGVILAILLGFVPAHVIASSREQSTYRGIDTQVEATQAAADTPEMYAQLDAFRAAQLEHKKSEQRSIALSALLVWAVAGGAVAFGWFRLAPWNRAAAA